MADSLTPIHDELDEILELINLDIEIMARFAEARLDKMVEEFNYRQQCRMVLWEWEQELLYG